ncbi:MAG TPA: hypothetical protein VFY13_04820 [Luteolibacter sp.]|nr:hypothetical protein [Luteolibacter sp.]
MSLAQFINRILELTNYRTQASETFRACSDCRNCDHCRDGVCDRCGRSCEPPRPACEHFIAGDRIMAEGLYFWDPPIGCSEEEFRDFLLTLKPGERVVECGPVAMAGQVGTIVVSHDHPGNVMVEWDVEYPPGTKFRSAVTKGCRRLSLHSG